MKKPTLSCCFTWIVFIELNLAVAFLSLLVDLLVRWGTGDFKKWGEPSNWGMILKFGLIPFYGLCNIYIYIYIYICVCIYIYIYI